MAKTRVLVIDDEESLRHYLKLLLEREGFDVKVAVDGEKGLQQALKEEFDIILCDIRMPERDGLGFLEEFRKSGRVGKVIMMSAYGSRDTAFQAINLGAYDYVDKPIQRDELLLAIHKLVEREKLQKENRRLQMALMDGYDDEGIIGRSESLKKVLVRAQKAAKFSSTVLITGENGTGKELVARAIHRWSDRADRELVDVNCGSIPENLLESELFGHARGAFTGAHRDHTGLFEAAHNGTLFLDEIGEIPVPLQVKLLRALQQGQIRRVGETQTRDIDVRIIAATNKNLPEEVDAGRFREDLFYRLNVVTLEIPPLRDRKEDIPLLLDFYMRRFNASLTVQQLDHQLKGVSPEAMRALRSYDWPGNVRELKNAIESAAISEETNQLTLKSLPGPIQDFESSATPSSESMLALFGGDLSIKRNTKKVERILIQKALEETEGNRTAAARLLDISHRALLYKMKDYEIS
ncbi:MAG: sigma-54-dependent Fis family transcriptional regulator [Deltaproteobacteria bacterium]|nr:MAG: sigma-54-dependent Fis family transcriptional regulator [Deltaproteobacteria bacterium]